MKGLQVPEIWSPDAGPDRALYAAMPFVITQSCVGTCDTGCVDVCPVDCIAGPVELDHVRSVPPSERRRRFPDVQLFIDPDECTDCGACVPECPVEAIHDAHDLPTAHPDIRRNAAFFEARRLKR